MKVFNTTGVCIPEKHYMVDISHKMEKIMKLIERGMYFTINRPRQCGKTTTLLMLQRQLPGEYTFINISFEGVGDAMFESPEKFCQGLLRQIYKCLKLTDETFATLWRDESITDFDLLSDLISTLTNDKKVILAIDEVDRTSNNKIFVHFLGMLRHQYLNKHIFPCFHNVILVGVHDIKNIKLKLIKEGLHTSPEDPDRLYNSPWNIAANFNVDMSFNPMEIATMLVDYEYMHKTGMSIDLVSNEIYKYTRGYPFLVSRICQIIEEDLNGNWTSLNVQEAVTILTTTDKNILFDDLFKNLHNNPEIYSFIYEILILGEHHPRGLYAPEVEWSHMLGFITIETNGEIYISNKIFEAILVKHFITAEAKTNHISNENSKALRYEITNNGVFDMELCMRRFKEFFNQVYANRDNSFYEKYGLLLFLAYLNPLVNGHGFYHIESETSDGKRVDIILNYGTNQYVIELKLC